MKRLLLGILGAVGALTLISTASAAHDLTSCITSLRVAFHHVLETDDLLVLLRFALVEDLSDPAESTYGPQAASLALYEDIADPPVQRFHPPRTGYGLAAVYLSASEATAITFGGADVRVCLEANPTLFGTPLDSCDSGGSLTWENTADSAATLAVLRTWTLQLVTSIEQDDPDLGSNTLVYGSYITDQGAPYVVESFPSLYTLVPTIFGVSGQVIGTPGTARPTTAFEATIEAEGRASDFAQGVEDLGEPFGIPFAAMGIGLAGVLVIVAGGLIYKWTQQADLALSPLAAILLICGRLALIPIEVVATIVCVVGIGGAAWAWKQSP